MSSCKKNVTTAASSGNGTYSQGSISSQIDSVTGISVNSATVIAQATGKNIAEKGICWDTLSNPTLSTNHADAYEATGSGLYKCQMKNLKTHTHYYIRPYVIGDSGVVYGQQDTIITKGIVIAVVETVQPIFIIGSSVASAEGILKDNGGESLSEKGVCISQQSTPTLSDIHSIKTDTTTGRYRGNFINLSPSTTYYIRAYAKNSAGVSYGQTYMIKTIAAGNLSYTLNESSAPSADELDAYVHIKAAMDSAMWYMNAYTTFSRTLQVNYNTGVPTAQASSNGNIDFGSNRSYMTVCTALHEVAHAMGVGTTNVWWNTLMISGKYQGKNCNQMLDYILNDSTQSLHGDTQHFWPYGLNYESEVTSYWDYVYHCLLMEAMKQDGLSW